MKAHRGTHKTQNISGIIKSLKLPNITTVKAPNKNHRVFKSSKSPEKKSQSEDYEKAKKLIKLQHSLYGNNPVDDNITILQLNRGNGSLKGCDNKIRLAAYENKAKIVIMSEDNCDSADAAQKSRHNRLFPG